MRSETELLIGKELADALGRERTYVTAMKRRGFIMPGGKATITEARAWLARNPPPRSRDHFKTAA
jgi:hypothetical protein